jgi:hypothetical protein
MAGVAAVDLETLIIFMLIAMLAGLPIIIWWTTARRRRAARKAQVVASLLRKQSEAWKRLGGSAAGAP